MAFTLIPGPFLPNTYSTSVQYPIATWLDCYISGQLQESKFFTRPAPVDLLKVVDTITYCIHHESLRWKCSNRSYSFNFYIRPHVHLATSYWAGGCIKSADALGKRRQRSPKRYYTDVQNLDRKKSRYYTRIQAKTFWILWGSIAGSCIHSN